MAINVQYYAPQTMQEALHILDENGKVAVLAGGTDLVRDMNLNLACPTSIMWIGHLDLEYITQENNLIRIGAATRMQTAGDSQVLREKAHALAQSAGRLASPPVRALATLGGNICTASPAGDTVCAMLALGAEVVLTSAKGERVLPLDQVFTGPGATVIQPTELLTEIRIQPTGQNEGSAYAKIGRRAALTLAVLNAAARVRLDGQGHCDAVTIAVGAAAPTPLRCVGAEAVLAGNPFSEENILEAARVASEEIMPIDDVHGTVWYRRRLTKVLVARTLHQAGGLEREG